MDEQALPVTEERKLYVTFRIVASGGSRDASAQVDVRNHPIGDDRLSAQQVKQIQDGLRASLGGGIFGIEELWLTNWIWLRPDEETSA